jgi:hypothetical protein
MLVKKVASYKFYGSGFVIYLPGFTLNSGESFDGYLSGCVYPQGNFPMKELYATKNADEALEMSRECAQQWLNDHPYWVGKGAKFLSV